ncbi:tetratricopeptide repeat protein 12-like [Lineus longissimus]|uniref:tetratricopeptide repeat protein 12-like n=1 Tax=Lineus longissimus TaxID=88925 RepID=UPI002B4F8261
MANEEQKKLDSFLEKVDGITELIQQMNYGSSEEQEAAKNKADDLLAIKSKEKDRKQIEEEAKYGKIGFDKAVVNKNAFENEQVGPPLTDPSMGQDAMMQAIAKDAQERGARRAKAHKDATLIKEKGNAEFKEGNYEKAVDHYTEALSILKDYSALWTNRAQAHLKLGNYQEALHDCEWALRVSDRCIKAYAHQGKAYLGLKEYDKARESYQQVLKCDPKKESLVNDYLAEVDLAQTSEEDERSANELFEGGDTAVKGLVEVIEKLKKPGQLPLYYSGGMRILAKAIVSHNDRTLFRTNGGLDLVKDHKVISSLFRINPQSQTKEGRDVCWALMELYTNVCTENDENIRQLLRFPDFTSCIQGFLELKYKNKYRFLREATIKFLVTVSQSDIGQSVIISKFDIPRLLASVLPVASLGGVIAANTMGLLNNLAIHKKFKVQIRNNVEDKFLPSFEALMCDTSSAHLGLLPTCITTITNLTNDSVIRQKMANRTESWDACVKVMERHGPKCAEKMNQEIVFTMLGLIINLTLETTEPCLAAAPKLTRCCCPLVTSDVIRIQARAFGALNKLLQKSEEASRIACDCGLHKTVLSNAKKGDINDEDLANCIKILTSCSKIGNTGHDIIYDGKGLGLILRLMKHRDETVVGNAALCLTNCLDVKGVCKRLTETDIIKDLLVLARDAKNPTCQQNCAILLGKLATKDTLHLEKLRELHGIEILHDCMKYIK